MVWFIFIIFGLVVGSFLNVVVYRLRAADTLMGRSYCPHCKKTIRWYDNIPLLSFILLHWRCRHCKKKISWQYPAVESLTALLFLFAGIKFFSLEDSATWAATVYYLIIISSLVAILVYDWLYMEIPSLVLWPAIGFAIGGGLILDWMEFVGPVELLSTRSFSGLSAAFLAFIFFFFLVAISKEKWMGMGDAYLAILLGFISGWPEVLLGMFLAFFIGSIYGLMLIAIGKKTLKSQLPFAPFMVIGTMISLFFFFPLSNWYLNLFHF